MTASVGTAGVVLGFLGSLIGAGALALGLRRGDERLLRTGRRTVFLTLVGALVAVAAMEWALLTHDFSLQ